MHSTIKNLQNIQQEVKQKLVENNLSQKPNVIAVSKTFKLDHINYLIDYGHDHFGENKVKRLLINGLKLKIKKKI